MKEGGEREREREVMAHLCLNHSIVARGSGEDLYYRNGSTKDYYNVSFTNQRRRLKQNRGLVHCCSSSTSTSADQQVNLDDKKIETNELNENKKLQLDYLVSDVSWQVRKMAETEAEMRQVANVQAEAFHEPVFLFDDVFFQFFKVIHHFLLFCLAKIYYNCF